MRSAVSPIDRIETRAVWYCMHSLDILSITSHCVLAHLLCTTPIRRQGQPLSNQIDPDLPYWPTTTALLQ